LSPSDKRSDRVKQVGLQAYIREAGRLGSADRFRARKEGIGVCGKVKDRRWSMTFCSSDDSRCNQERFDEIAEASAQSTQARRIVLRRMTKKRLSGRCSGNLFSMFSLAISTNLSQSGTTRTFGRKTFAV
jgi:hypothetical protein